MVKHSPLLKGVQGPSPWGQFTILLFPSKAHTHGRTLSTTCVQLSPAKFERIHILQAPVINDAKFDTCLALSNGQGLDKLWGHQNYTSHDQMVLILVLHKQVKRRPFKPLIHLPLLHPRNIVMLQVGSHKLDHSTPWDGLAISEYNAL